MDDGTAPNLDYGALPAHSDFGLTWWSVPHGVLRFGDPESKILRLLPVFRAFENLVGPYVGSPSSTGDE